jgi:serine/threonine protein kinase
MERYETEDDLLEALVGAVVPSSYQADVSYRVSRVIAKGGTAAAFLAVRCLSNLTTPVVLKVVRPTILEKRESTATLSVMKESVALGRLNERVPPTPYVVRLIDSGSMETTFAGHPMSLPWLVLEYVHGGAEGTTLEERIRFSVDRTGYAFDRDRAAVAIACIAGGLSAVHEVGVLHRDITLRNVLCSGFGEEELFKISDFGLARPVGIEATFGTLSLGTPGYAAPEQMFGDKESVGPWTDVFSMACVAFAILTGQDYFVGNNDFTTMMATRKPERKSVTSSPHLCRELRERPLDCKAIDEVLARATALSVQGRPRSAIELADLLVPHLHTRPYRGSPSARHVQSIVTSTPTSREGRWVFTECCPPLRGRIVRDAAWDGTSRCLVATSTGLAFWSGTDWSDIHLRGLPGDGAEVVERLPDGDWLVAGEGVLIRMGTGGKEERISVPSTDERIEMADGDLDDLAIVIATGSQGPPVLHAAVARRWLKPLPAHGMAAIAAATRIGDDQWLVVGRTNEQKGFVAVYAPLSWELRVLHTYSTRVMLACASQRHRKLALVAGTDGTVGRLDDDQLSSFQIPGSSDFSAAAIDIEGRFWLGAPGELWSSTGERWECVWRSDTAPRPIRSIFAETGLVMMMTVDGRIIEGRLE